MSKKRIILISITLVTVAVLGLLLFIPIFNNIVNITKTDDVETSKLESDILFQNAYYDEKTGEVKGLTEEEQKILDKILEETQQYFKDKDIDVKIEQIANNEIEVALENVSKEQSSTLKNEVLTKLSTSIKTELGDVITDEMITSIQTDEELNKQVETEIGNYISEMGDGLDSFVKTEIVDSLDDEIEDDLTKFILSNTGKEMAQEILSGNVSDIFSNYGDVLVGSVTGGVKDLVNYKVSDKIFGDVDNSVKILLGDRLDIVGKAGDIIGIDLDNVIGLQDKLIDNIAGDITGTFSNTIGGALVGDISDGITTYMDSIGGGIADSITGGLVEGIAGIPGIADSILGEDVLKRIENINAKARRNDKISYEDLWGDSNLFCVQHGAKIPARSQVNYMSGFLRESGLHKTIRNTNQQDATVGDFAPMPIEGITFEGEEDLKSIGRRKSGNYIEPASLSAFNSIQAETGGFGGHAFAPNSTVYNTFKKVTTYTIGKYNSVKLELQPEQAYILAHIKNTKFYPDHVQQALWRILNQTSQGERWGVNPEQPEEIGQRTMEGSSRIRYSFRCIKRV